MAIVKLSTKPKKTKQKFASAEAAKRHRELEDSWDKMMAKHTSPNFSAKSRVAVSKTTRPAKVEALPLGKQKSLRQTSTPGITYGKPESLEKAPVKLATHLRYDGEMLKRELEAQERTEELKKSVAPICNKGGYQYITNPDDAKTVGRKV